jgi:hypothetical protein
LEPAGCAPASARFRPQQRKSHLCQPEPCCSRWPAAVRYGLLCTSGFHRPLDLCEGRQSWRQPNGNQSATSNCNTHDPVTRRSADQWINGGRCSHGGAEARRKQREESATGHKGNWRVSCFCLCVKHPWLPTGVLHCPGPGHPPILCGCINIPGRQVNAVWGMGSMPYRMYDVCKKEAGSLLGALRQNLSRLRVEKLGCAGSRQVIPAVSLNTSTAN